MLLTAFRQQYFKTKKPESFESGFWFFYEFTQLLYENLNPISSIFLPPKIEQNIEFPLRLIVDVEIVIFDTVVFIFLYIKINILFRLNLNTMQK